MICEGCRAVEATERVEDAEAGRPFRVCVGCARRAVTGALRPREWFHLRATHGAAFLLHDDLYDDDGTALQPESPVLDAAAHPFPTDVAWRADAMLAFEVALVRQPLSDELADVLRGDPHASLARLEALEPPLRGAGCAIARALGPPAARWVRERWSARDVTAPLLGRASASCLPADEALALMTAAVDAAEGFARTDAMLALSALRDRRVLDHVERWVRTPVEVSFGNLAAASRLDWPLAERWLTAGPPLTVVALDALAAIARPGTPTLRALAPTLMDPPDRPRFDAALDAAVRRWPEVERRIHALRADADALGVSP